MKLYRDCQLKGKILGIILRKGGATSREIYEQVQHPNYAGLRSELSQLKRRHGYITTLSDKKPYVYILTKKGRLHAQDPYLTIKRRQKNIQLKVAALLNNDVLLQQIVDSELYKRLCQMPFVSSHFPPFFPADPYQQAAYILDELKFKDAEIASLQNQLQLTRAQTNECRNPPVNPKNPINQKPQRERALYRQRLAELYVSQRRLLDLEFFKQWGDVYPCQLGHMPLFRAGSVGLISMSNSEQKSDKRMLDSNEIDIAEFYIMQMRKDGILIGGKGMTSEKLVRW